MDLSSIDVSSFSSSLFTSPPLVSALVLGFLLLFFHLRSKTSYVPISRLYSILAGKAEFQDSKLAEFWQSSKDLERFNAIYSFGASSISEAKRFLIWIEMKDYDVHKFYGLGAYLDFENLSVKKPKGILYIVNFIGFVLFTSTSLFTIDVVSKDAALVRFKTDDQLLWLGKESAFSAPYQIPFKGYDQNWTLDASKCESKSFDAAAFASEAKLQVKTVESICGSFGDQESAKYVQEMIDGQKSLIIYLIIFIALSFRTFVELKRMLLARSAIRYMKDVSGK
jgi:hypothetical protein